MKSLYFLLSSMLISAFIPAFGQECQDLMISEVIEGWSNNKAIEIYNPTSEAIDASGYGLVRFQNGSTTPGNITYLEGVTIAPYDVYVVVLDKRDPDGVDFEAPVWDELQQQADSFVNPLYNDGQEVMYFNGNDALALLTNEGESLVDVFGKIGDAVNPDGWGGYVDSFGEQAYISANHTLVRKPEITVGYDANPSTFEILNEYDSLPANTFDQLGFHNCECNVNSIEKLESSALKLFPNPSSDGIAFVSSSSKVEMIEVYSNLGKLEKTIEFDPSQHQVIDLSTLPKGYYYLKARLLSGEEVTSIFIR